MGDEGAFGLPKASAEERQKALQDPGPSWRDWFYGSMMKLYIPLGYLILDTWGAGTWLEAYGSLGGAATLAAIVLTLLPALYLEFVLYEYLWARPSGDLSRSVRSEFRPTWRRPFEYGRWTEAGRRRRAGLPAIVGSVGVAEGEPDPSEFF